jgi:magnesium chelatase subunit I
VPGLSEALKALDVGDRPAQIASAAEFILEGLHLHQKLNKEREGGRSTYRA